MKDYAIDRLAWQLQANRDYPEVHDRRRRRMRTLVLFLQTHGLTQRTLLADNDPLGDDFVLMTSDLTPEGLAFSKVVYSNKGKWFRGQDRGNSSEDATLLEKELIQFRQTWKPE